MSRSRKCIECGGSVFDKSRLLTHGEASCDLCGLVVMDWVLDSSPAPLKEGDDTRPGGVIRRAASGVRLDPTPREGDILRNIPAGKKIAICYEKSGGCGNSQLIKEFDEACENCDGIFWKYKQNLKSLPPRKDEGWIYKRQAKQFLGLERNQNEDDLSEDIKNLNLNRRWIELVVDAISDPGLPVRAPEEEE